MTVVEKDRPRLLGTRKGLMLLVAALVGIACFALGIGIGSRTLHADAPSGSSGLTINCGSVLHPRFTNVNDEIPPGAIPPPQFVLELQSWVDACTARRHASTVATNLLLLIGGGVLVVTAFTAARVLPRRRA